MQQKEHLKPSEILSLIISMLSLFISIFTFIFSAAPRFNFLSRDTIKKAEDGDFKSQMYLADIYLKTNEYENSYYWYRLAALNIDNEDVGFAYAALGFLGNNGYFSSENSSLSHNIEQTINFYDNAIHYAEQNQYNTAIQKQIYINYLVFLLSNENPKSEIDTNGNLIESKYLNTTDSFIHNNISKIKELLNKLYYLDNDLFKNMDNLSFPIEDEIFLEKYINGDNIPIKKWVYDYTTIASKGNLAYVGDAEKLVYVDSLSSIKNSASELTFDICSCKNSKISQSMSLIAFANSRVDKVDSWIASLTSLISDCISYQASEPSSISPDETASFNACFNDEYCSFRSLRFLFSISIKD